MEDLFTQLHQSASLTLRPISSCPIEFDVHSSCIHNMYHIQEMIDGDTDSSIPISYVKSLTALWHEEMKRRKSRGIITPLCSLTPPFTQTTHRMPGESEREFRERLESLFRKGEELHGESSSEHMELSQWSRNCLERRSQYADSFQEFSQRVEYFLDREFEMPLKTAENSPQKPVGDDNEDCIDDEADEEKNDVMISQKDVEDIIFTNTAFISGDELDVRQKNEELSTESPHRLGGYLHQVFEDSPVFEINPLTLQQTSKQGRRKRSRVDDTVLRTPEKSSTSFLDPFDSPIASLHFQDQSPIPTPQPLASLILSPTFQPPRLTDVVTSFYESKSGWYHTIPHYSSVNDVSSGLYLQSGVHHIQSSEKGRFGWLPQDIQHKDQVNDSVASTFMNHEDPLKRLIEFSQSTTSYLARERLLVPTFSPPRLELCHSINREENQPEEILQMTPVLSGSSQSQDDNKTRRVFFKTAIPYPSPMKSQIATPTQTQGNVKKSYAMNVKSGEQPLNGERDDSPQVPIRGRTTVLSMEIFCSNRAALIPNPKFDEVLCLCWVSLCFIAIGDTEIEQQSSGVICNCRTISPSALRIIVQGSGKLPSDVVISPVTTEKDLILQFVEVVRSHVDPDILVGYEVQKDSWGYLIDRANVLNIALLQELSRTPLEKPSTRNEHDKYGEEHESGIHITGRMTINLWRRMRHELKLFSYTVGSISRHLLGESFPEYTPQQLTSWFREKSSMFRVIRHIYRRAALNHSFIDKLDLIRRISESSRLYGVEFYSVISRGSQFKVEAVMLRVAKKKGYVAISPSKRSVANQAAMAVIPLVMEPQSNFYVDPVNVLDFQSLYPSLIISYNLCFSTILAQVRPGTSGDDDTTGALGVLPYPEEYVVKNLYDTYLRKSRSATSRPLISPSGALFVGPETREGTESLSVV